MKSNKNLMRKNEIIFYPCDRLPKFIRHNQKHNRTNLIHNNNAHNHSNNNKLLKFRINR